MSFAIFTDGCSNLPGEQIRKYGIRVLPFTYTLDGVQHVYDGNIDNFDAPAHYNLLRSGHLIQTSLLNTQLFADHFRLVELHLLGGGHHDAVTGCFGCG
jgi:fatty acid-binding protein DegV